VCWLGFLSFLNNGHALAHAFMENEASLILAASSWYFAVLLLMFFRQLCLCVYGNCVYGCLFTVVLSSVPLDKWTAR